MTPRHRIAVAGAGIGGLAAAAFLARAGHDVTVFDRFESPAPVGSGLVIQPIGQMVLGALGVGDRAAALGTVIHHMEGIEAGSGRKVLNVSYDLKRRSRFGLAMHRASLFDCVFHAATRAGATLVSATHISGTDIGPQGRVLQGPDGPLGPFDLVIDGSGAESPLSPMTAVPLGYGALWGVVDTPPGPPGDTLAQCYARASRMVGILPVGRLPGGDTQKTAIFWSLHRDAYASWRAAPFTDWVSEAAAFWPAFGPYVAQLTGPEDLTMTRYSHGTLRWPIADRLAFIGDAAHRTSPQLGQGANMALLDAMALAQALEHRSIADALVVYARNRRWHVRIYQMMSRAFTPFYQSDSRLLPLARDHLLAPISGLPGVRGLLQKMVSGELVSLGPVAHFGQTSRGSDRQ